MRGSVRVAVLGVVLAAVCAAGALTAVATAHADGPLPKVTFIGDSEATGLLDWKDAVATATQGADIDFQLAPCRRLVAESCPYGGVRPPTLVDLVSDPSFHLAPIVIVAVGYNDYVDRYAADIEQSLQALDRAGARRVIWLTLRSVRQPYLAMNDDILAAAAMHPELTVADWDGYSRGKDWFESDGIHFGAGGAQGYGTFLHQTLVGLGIVQAPATSSTTTAKATPVRVVTHALPAARIGRFYNVRLAASAGRRPYTWTFPRNPPDGLHVAASGRIFGTPRGKPHRLAFVVEVRDAAGGRAAATLTLRVVR